MKSLYARPSNVGCELSFKLRQIIATFARQRGYTAEGDGLALTPTSDLTVFLEGARAALDQTSGRGVEDIPDMQRDLHALLALVKEHRSIVLEAR